MKIWMVALGVYLVLQSLAGLIGLNFQYKDELVDLLALVAGVLILLRV